MHSLNHQKNDIACRAGIVGEMVTASCHAQASDGVRFCVEELGQDVDVERLHQKLRNSVESKVSRRFKTGKAAPPPPRTRPRCASLTHPAARAGG